MIYELSEENLHQFFGKVKGYIDETVERLAAALVEQGTLPEDWNQPADIPAESAPSAASKPAFDSKTFAQSVLNR